jgi:chain length determinant protein EpsF
MHVQLLLSTLRARFGVFALVVCATVLAATVVSLLLPKTYKATTSLLVDAKDAQSLSGGAGTPQFSHPLEKTTYMQTQMDIIGSETVARKVVQDLKLAENPEARAAHAKSGGAGSIEDKIARDLLLALKVDGSQSSIIQVTYMAGDPRSAAAVANAFAKAYSDTVLDMRTAPTRQAAAWFDEQLKVLRENVQEAQSALAEYQRKKGIVATDERLDVESVRLGELSTQLARAQDTTLGWQARGQQARDALAQGQSPERLADVQANPLVQTLKTDILRGEAKLKELASQYGTSYPTYQRQLTENQSLREKLDGEMAKIAAGFESSSRQSRQQEAGLAGAMAAQRDRLLKLRESRSELAVLARNAESAQRTYETALQRAVLNKVESSARGSNVAVLSPAVEPPAPARPKVGLNVALSLVIGIILGLATIVLMELLDRRVRSHNDLASEPNVPLLAVLNTWDPAAVQRLPGWSGSAHRTLPKPA